MSRDRSLQLLVGAIVAAVVALCAAWAGVSVVVLLVAAVGAVVAFLLFDSRLAAEAASSTSVDADVAGTDPNPPDTPPESAPEPAASGEGDDGDDDATTETTSARLDPALFDPESVEIKTSAETATRAFSIRVSKHGQSIAECEDAVTVDPRRALLAVADGASASFAAGEWATALAQRFVTRPPKPLSVASFSAWLDEARESIETAVDGDDAESADRPGWWSDEGARRGAFSTVVGAAVMTDGDKRVVTVMCVGDSCAFVLTGSAGERVLRRALPYEDASQFGSHPAMLGSIGDRHHRDPSWTTVPTVPGDVVILASDAVAEWLLRNPRRFEMFDVDEPAAIAQRLVEERIDGTIVNDDLTVALLEMSE